jgi:putative hemolysin
MPPILLITLLFIFLLLSGFFSLTETAVLSSNRYRIRHLAATGNKRAKKLAEWLTAPQRLLASILLGNNFANIGAATVAASIVAGAVDEGQRDILLAFETVLLTLIVLLFCELGPKAFATRTPEKISLRLVLPIEFWMRISYPIAQLSINFAGLFYRSVRESHRSLAASISDVELKSIINSYTQDRRKMLERVLDFSERQVRDVMVPRMKTVALAIETPIEEVLRVVETTRLTRFPVYHRSLDNVLGIMHGKDLMPYLHSSKTLRLSQLLRKPVFIPDTARLNNAVTLLQSAQTHLGIVVDEHGGVEGIVTLEDLIEQIVGEIQDEHDIAVDEIIPQPDGGYVIDAGISVRELNERLGLDVPENGYYVTLAGFMMVETGRVPSEGDTVEFGGSTYAVEQMVGRRIMRIRLTPSESQREPHDSVQDVTESEHRKATYH